VYQLIDKINPDLNYIETDNRKRRFREFYVTKAEEAFALLHSIAKMSGTEDQLHLYKTNK
jgi:phage-related protein